MAVKQKAEIVQIVECPRLNGEEIPVEKCQACKFHGGIDKTDYVVCEFK